MTAREMSARVGTHVYIEPVAGLRFRCRVTDAKTAYGHSRIQIEAVEGEGRAWVSTASVTPCYPDPARSEGGAHGVPR